MSVQKSIRAVVVVVLLVVTAVAGWRIYRQYVPANTPKDSGYSVEAELARTDPNPPASRSPARDPSGHSPDPAPPRLPPVRLSAVKIEFPQDAWRAASSMDTPTRKLSGATGLIACVRFSPDGKTIASGGADRIIRLWDLETGALLKSFPPLHTTVTGLAFSSDGKCLAAAERTGAIMVIDVAGNRIEAELRGHAEQALHLQFIPGDKRIISSGCDGTLRLWNIAGQKQEHLVKLGQGGCSRGLALHPDGKLALAASSDGSVVLINLETGAIEQEIANLTEEIRAVTFSDAGKRVLIYLPSRTLIYDLAEKKIVVDRPPISPAVVDATTNGDGSLAVASFGGHLELWSPEQNRPLGSLWDADGAIWSVDMTRDGRYVVAAGGNDAGELFESRGKPNTVCIWDLHKGELLSSENTLTAMAVGDSWQNAACGDARGNLFVLDPNNPGPPRSFKGHTAAITSLAFNAAGKNLLSASQDRSIRVWDVASGTERGRWVAATQPVGARWLGAVGVVGGVAEKLTLWKFRQVAPQVLGSCASPITCTAVSADGNFVLTGESNGTVSLWDATKGALVRHLDRDKSTDVTGVLFGEGDRTAIVCDHMYRAVVFDLSTGTVLKQLREVSLNIDGLVRGRDPKQLVVLGPPPALQIIDMTQGERIAEFRGQLGTLLGASISPDGTKIMMASSHGGLRLRALTPKLLMPDQVRSMQWQMLASPDGTMGLTREFSDRGRGKAADGPESIVRLRSLLTGETIRTYPVGGKSGGLAVSADGKQIIAASDTSASIYDLATAKVIHKIDGPAKSFGILALSPDGKILAAADAPSKGRGAVRLWNSGSGQLIATIPCEEALVFGLSWSADSKRLLTRTGHELLRQEDLIYDHAARVWDAETGKKLMEFPLTDRHFIGAWFTPDGKDILLVDPFNIVQVIDASSYELKQVVSLGTFAPWVQVAAMSADGNTLLVIRSEGEVVQWDRRTGEVTGQWNDKDTDHQTLPFFRGSQPMLWRCKQNGGRVWSPDDSSAGGDS